MIDIGGEDREKERATGPRRGVQKKAARFGAASNMMSDAYPSATRTKLVTFSAGSTLFR